MILLYLDQNYLSGIVKRKPAFRELEPVLRAAVARGTVGVPESRAHRVESQPRPDLPLLDMVRELAYHHRLTLVAADHFPERTRLESDTVDLEAIALALPRCGLITCDAFMADVVRRTRLDVLCDAEIYTGRRADVDRLRKRLENLSR
jgi:hypothetical protein